MEVKKGHTILTVPHEGKDLNVIWNPVRGNYESQRNQLKEEGMKYQISAPELASLLGDAYQNKEEEFPAKIIKIMSDSYFRNSTESLWLPRSKEELSNGVIVYDNSNLKNSKFSIKKSDLLKKLEGADELRIKGHPVFISKDKSVRYTPFGFKTGVMNSFELAKNPYNVALHLEEGAEKIAEISTNYKKNPSLFAYNSVENEKRTTSALDGSWCFGWGLYVDGDYSGLEGGHSLGVLKE